MILKSASQTIIPQHHRLEWHERLVKAFRKRVNVLCVGLLVIYVLSQVMTGVLDAEHFVLKHRIVMWCVSLAGTLVVLVMNHRAKRLYEAKGVAYFFTLFMVLFVVYFALFLAPGDGLFSLISVLILLLFFVSLVIPWSLRDVFFLTVISIGGYLLYAVVIHAYAPSRIGISIKRLYFDGPVWLTLAGVLCSIIRYSDIRRDIRNYLLLKEIDTKNKQMEGELSLASRVQRTLVPQSISTPKLDVNVTYLPVSSVGGDYGKFHFVNEDQFLMLISDVTGHGVPAALLVNRLHSEFERLVLETTSPGSLLSRMNQFILREFDGTGMYLSAFCARLDFKTYKFTYSNYGHPSQYLYRMTDRNLVPLASHTSLLGAPMEYMGPQSGTYENELEFVSGDRFLLFTDGVIETKNFDGEEYGIQRLENFVGTHYDVRGETWNRYLIHQLEDFKYGPFKDDIFILNISTH